MASSFTRYSSTLNLNSRITPIDEFNDAQLDCLSNIVLDEAGFISTINESMEIKWNRIRLRLMNSSGNEFSSCQLALWEGLYKQYKDFKHDLINFHEIDPETMDMTHVDEGHLKSWAVLILHMEKYRKLTNQVSHELHYMFKITSI